MNIEVRRYHIEDAEKHCSAVRASIEYLKDWFTWASPDYCLGDSIKFIEEQPNQEKKGNYSYGIFDNDDGEFLGNCGLSKVKTYHVEQISSMSYWRNQSVDKKNFMRQGLEKVKDKAFNKLGIKRIEIDVAYCNEKSIELAKRIRAEPERDIQIRGGDGKIHEGTRYVIQFATKA